MKNLEAIVFDMDGTLYQFPDGATFGNSPLGKMVIQNTTSFIGNEFELSDDEAQARYAELSRRYSGEMSLGLEQEFGIDRMRFFNETWNIDPENIIVPEPGLGDNLRGLDVRCTLLTAAPRVWAQRALGYIGIKDLFENRIFTGEPDIRKPNPEIFRRVANQIGVTASRIVSIGDQEFSDIAPAREIGMKTVRIGDNVESDADFVARDIGDALAQLRREGLLS